jgi:TatA/E family protein of Tat protein translocase
MMIGLTEVLLILAVVALFFGAGRLPEVMGSIGSAYKEFKDAERNPDGPPDAPGGGSKRGGEGPPA